LVADAVFSEFSNVSSAETTLFYGHSYMGNALACAAAKASLELFEMEMTLERLGPKIELLRSGLKRLRALPAVKEVRQCGFIAGIEVTENGAQVCQAAHRHGLLTRPFRDVIVLMPPFCISETQIESAIEAIRLAALEECTDS
jgi:adenosylmethionine---8-amino-7-oxononanoate aminotransferase